jgi:hypothetical protein
MSTTRSIPTALERKVDLIWSLVDLILDSKESAHFPIRKNRAVNPVKIHQ